MMHAQRLKKRQNKLYGLQFQTHSYLAVADAVACAIQYITANQYGTTAPARLSVHHTDWLPPSPTVPLRSIPSVPSVTQEI